MGNHTNIQWADGTVSPVPSCDGCPLRLPEAAVKKEIVKRLRVEGFDEEAIATAIATYRCSTSTSRRQRIKEAVSAAIPGATRGRNNLLLQIVQDIYGVTSHCYAGVLTDNRGGKIKGYAERFEELTMIPGRTGKAAKVRQARKHRPDKPWLNGSRRLWFVNDMGDGLSKGVPFEFLKKEIVDVALSENGRRSLWLWLTKRPRRMAEFSRWLKNRGIEWPQNLIPMTSVLNRAMAGQVKHLLEIPAEVRALSVEPLLDPVKLDLRGIKWVIVGGESGLRARPFDLAWARDIREQCKQAGVAFFMKQLGSNPVVGRKSRHLVDKHGGNWNEWPKDLRIRQVPDTFKLR